jgi:hypothetical protein
MNILDEIAENPSQNNTYTPNQPVVSSVQNSAQNAPLTRSPEQAKKSNVNKVLLFVVILLLAAVSALGFMYYKESQADSKQATQAEVRKLADTVSRLVSVPEDETPTVATVIDAEKIKKNNPNFYKDVQNGDKMLVYSDRVILYDVSKGVVLNMVLVDTTKLQQTAEDKLQEDSEEEGDVAGEETPD